MTLSIPPETELLSHEVFDMASGTLIVEVIDGAAVDRAGSALVKLGYPDKEYQLVMYTAWSRAPGSKGIGPTIVCGLYSNSFFQLIYSKSYDKVKDRWWMIKSEKGWLHFRTSPDRENWSTVGTLRNTGVDTPLLRKYTKGMQIHLCHGGIRKLGNVEIGEMNVSYEYKDEMPYASTLAFMETAPDGYWNAKRNRVAVVDQGTTKELRDKMKVSLVYREYTVGTPKQILPSYPYFEIYQDDEIFTFQEHGCLVMPNCMVNGGELVDIIITNISGSADYATIVSGMSKASNAGAKLINLSFGGLYNIFSQQMINQFFIPFANVFRQLDKILTISMGNDGQYEWGVPAIMSTFCENVLSVGAFDPLDGRRAEFSNYKEQMSCVGPGVNVASYTPAGTHKTWLGTSASSPYELFILGCLVSGMSPTEALKLFKETLRPTGQPLAEQGGGTGSLFRALRKHGVINRRAALVGTV